VASSLSNCYVMSRVAAFSLSPCEPHTTACEEEPVDIPMDIPCSPHNTSTAPALAPYPLMEVAPLFTCGYHIAYWTTHGISPATSAALGFVCVALLGFVSLHETRRAEAACAAAASATAACATAARAAAARMQERAATRSEDLRGHVRTMLAQK